MPDILSVKDLQVSRKKDSAMIKVIDGLSFDLDAGQIIDVTGPSGCGKSTMIAALAFMIHKDGGTIELEGKHQAEFDPVLWRTKVSLILQKAVMIKGSVRDNLLLPWKLKIRKDSEIPGDDVLRFHLDKVGLQQINLDRNAEELSGGEQSRISLLRSLLTRPRVLLLDETDAPLDRKTARQVLTFLQEYIRDKEMGIIRVQHHDWDDAASKRIELSK